MSDAGFTDLLLRPRDPILLRDGRPFSAEPGARARTLPWPLPHTLAGALRTHVGNAQGFDWGGDGPEKARGLHLRGPLLATQDIGGVWQILIPAPRDGVFFRDPDEKDPQKKAVLGQTHTNGKPGVICLRPLPELPSGAGTLALSEGLCPLEVTDDRKPEPAPPFWTLSRSVDWLALPNHAEFTPDGAGALPTETRTFVQIDPATQTGQTGRLYSADLLCFADFAAGKTPAQALLCRLMGAEGLPAEARFLPLGGERRLATVAPAEGVAWPEAHAFPALTAALTGKKKLRLQLVTPALFVGGWKPGWLKEGADGLTGEVPSVLGLRLTLAGAAIGRPAPVSGWDLQKRRPKLLRYAAPAGSVYFFEVEGGPGLTAAQAEALFLRPINDKPEDDADGFGLALPGVW